MRHNKTTHLLPPDPLVGVWIYRAEDKTLYYCRIEGKWTEVAKVRDVDAARQIVVDAFDGVPGNHLGQRGYVVNHLRRQHAEAMKGGATST